MNFEDFVSFYKTYGMCPNDLQKRKSTLNETQLKRRYEQFLSSEEKKQRRLQRSIEKMKEKKKEIDERWEKLKLSIDLSECAFLEKLKVDGYNYLIQDLYEHAGHLIYIIDPAHVFSRGSYPHMKYDKDNIIPLNRYSHLCLDEFRDPVYCTQITSKEVEVWWEYIIGKEHYKYLKMQSERRGLEWRN